MWLHRQSFGPCCMDSGLVNMSKARGVNKGCLGKDGYYSANNPAVVKGNYKQTYTDDERFWIQAAAMWEGGRSKAADRQGASQQQEAQVGQEREASIISHVTLAPQSLWRLHQHPPQRPQHQQPSSPAALHCAQRLSGSSWCRARVCHWIAINKGESALQSRESRKNGGGGILSLLFSRNLSTHL